MTLAEKAEVLADAGVEGSGRACFEINCDECQYKEYDHCQIMVALLNLEKMGYDVVIQ